MTATAVETSDREAILAHLRAGRPEDFLTLATPYLARHNDGEVRLLAVREYLRLNLVEPARTLLTDTDDLTPELASIRDSLGGLAMGEVSWSALTPRFEANLAVLERRGLEVEPIRSAWAERGPTLRCFCDKRSQHQILWRDAEGVPRWIPSLADHERIDRDRPFPPEPLGLMPDPFLFDGLGLGGFFERVYRETKDTFLGYSCALFIVEPDPLWIALVLHLRDWRDLLADERVFLTVGPDCTQRLQRFWEEDANLPLPRHVFSLNLFRPGPQPPIVEAVQAAADRRGDEIRRLRETLNARYAERNLRYWGERFEAALSGNGPPLRILAAVSTHTTFLQYSMRDAKRALEALGHECIVLTESTPCTRIETLTYLRTIDRFDPDLFFIIDHLRPEFDELLPAQLPVLTWDQDQLPHVFTRDNIRKIGPYDFVVGYSKGRCVDAGCDPRQLLNARVPTCPEQFDGPPLSEDERRRYTCDVSYVSHASQTPDAFHQEERGKRTDPAEQRLLDVLYELAPEMLRRYTVLSSAVAEVMIREALRLTGFRLVDEDFRQWLINWYLWRLGDRMFRHEALEWVADWAKQTGRTLRIYGRGWEHHPTLSPFAAGPAQNGRELLCIYRASRINLQLMPAGFVHQRSLDGLAAGGFFLARRTPYDLKGVLLRRLVERMNEQNVRDTHELLTHPDPTLRELLHAFHGQWLDKVDPYANDLFGKLHILAELDHPEEVFPRFADILFDSAERFAERAEYFLTHPEEREALTNEMREVVVRRFSYRPTMDRFLRAMGEYFRERGRESA